MSAQLHHYALTSNIFSQIYTPSSIFTDQDTLESRWTKYMQKKRDLINSFSGYFTYISQFFFPKKDLKKLKDWLESIQRCQDVPWQLPHGEVPLYVSTSADYPSTPTFPMSLPSLILPLPIIFRGDEKLNVYKIKCSCVRMHSCQGILLETNLI